MRVRIAKKGKIFRCSTGHYFPEALLVEGQQPEHLNDTYCLVCFGARVVGRLNVPRAEEVDDPFESAEPELVVAEEVPVAQAEEVPDPHKAQAEQPAAKPKPRAKRRTGAKRRR